MDIDPGCNPDIVGSITDIGDIGEFDVVYSCHCLEHVHGHEVARVLAEFHRVLRPGGAVLIFVPDLENVHPTDEVLFNAPVGPITGMDLFYGKQDMIERMPHMAHKTGFTANSLKASMDAAGFMPVAVKRLHCFNLFGAGRKL